MFADINVCKFVILNVFAVLKFEILGLPNVNFVFPTNSTCSIIASFHWIYYMTSITYAHIWPTSNRLVCLLIEQASCHYMWGLFILISPYLRSRNSPIKTKEIQQLFLLVHSISVSNI